MGYDAPDTLTAAVSPEYGKYAAAALSADLLGYDTANLAVDGKSPNLTVIGHSYGAYLSGLALSESTPDGLVDNFIYLGAPGLGVEDLSELNVDQENVYGVINGLDPVPELGNASNAVGGDFGPSPYADIGLEGLKGTYLKGAPFGVHDYYGESDVLEQLAEVAVAQ
ncbi:MAG: alpha/beta hydrolase, partial [Antricoccus sp.]